MKTHAFRKTTGIVLAAALTLATTVMTAGAVNIRPTTVNSTHSAVASFTSEASNKSAIQNPSHSMLGLDKLVDDETITQEQADAITEAFKTATENDTKMDFDTILSDLVGDGTLTQDEADAITDAMPTPGERPEHSRGMFGLDKLIEDGTITQDQADAVTSALKATRENDTKVGFDTILSELVNDGTLTQDEADAISNSILVPNTEK